MIWALLFALLFAASGSSPLIIPKLDKYAKKHIEVKANSKQVVDLIKADRKKRKAINKQHKGNLKELVKLNYSRTTTEADFTELFREIIDVRDELQIADVKLKTEVQKYITEKEWDLIVEDNKKAISKSLKKKQKKMLKIDKKFDKMVNQVSEIVQNENKLKGITAALNEFQKVIKTNLKTSKEYMSDDTSLIYSYESSSSEIREIQERANQMRQETFESYAKTHFEVVKLTTEDEWKSIVKRFKKVY